MRIRLSDAAEYTHAEVSLDTYGSIHLRLMKIQELSHSDEEIQIRRNLLLIVLPGMN